MQQRGHRAGHGDTACGAQFLHLGEPAPPESVFLRTGPPPGRSPWDRHPLPEKPGRLPIIDGPLGLLDADHLGALLEFRQHAVCLPSLDLQGRLAFLPRIPFGRHTCAI